MQSLLNISDYFVEELRVKVNGAYKGTSAEEGALETSVGIKRKGKEPHFMIQMKIELNRDKADFDEARYYVYLDISGFFNFTEGTDEETIRKMIGLNGPAILYGVARGVVAQATANCRYGKFVLPAMNFVKAIKKGPPEKGHTRRRTSPERIGGKS
jgi:preprotein translocase subunit SecB